MNIVTEYLHVDHHAPGEAKANGDMTSIYFNLTDEQCNNVVSVLYEVEFKIDVDTGRILSVKSGGQELRIDKQDS